MGKMLIRRLTWVDTPDGGGGHPMSHKKDPGEYIRMVANGPIIVIGVLVGLVLWFFQFDR